MYPEGKMAYVELKNISKIYDDGTKAVSNVNIQIKDKEFVVLVGPSGCGKTTTLRMIAGLEEISEGELYIDGKLVNSLSPKDRDIAMVFQNYALYPHMNVYDNIAFGLKLRKFNKDEIDKRVKEVADILGLSESLRKKPKSLSGGQRQRVALGRAIVRNPKVFLFDEPLSNLDAKLRVQMRAEISKLHKKLNATIIYVTHDQVEAMTMGDRIVVMESGLVKQTDSPMKIYQNPVNKFVAGFIGTPSMNFIEGKLNFKDSIVFVSKQSKIDIPIMNEQIRNEKNNNKEVILGIRPENILLNNRKEESGRYFEFKSRVELIEPLGSQMLIHLFFGKQPMIAEISGMESVDRESEISFYIDLTKVHLFYKENGKNLLSLQ